MGISSRPGARRGVLWRIEGAGDGVIAATEEIADVEASPWDGWSVRAEACVGVPSDTKRHVARASQRRGDDGPGQRRVMTSQSGKLGREPGTGWTRRAWFRCGSADSA